MLAMLTWATTYPITDRLLETWDPMSLAATRIIGAGILLACLTIVFSRKTLNWQEWPIMRAMLTGMVGLGAGTLLMNFGFQYSNPVNVAVIATTVPLVSLLMGMARGEERMTMRIGIALCCALIGGVMVSLSNLSTPAGFEGGELLMILAVISWTWFSRSSVKYLAVIPAYPRTALTLFSGGLVLLPIMALVHWLGIFELHFDWNSAEITWPVALILGVALSTSFWMLSADRIGVTVAAIHVNVVPFYVVLLMLLFGGSLLMTQIAGAVLVSCGVILAQLPPRSKNQVV